MAVTSINTYFGDYLLGLWVTWETAQSVEADGYGTTDLTVTFQANLRAKLYVYGLGSHDGADTWMANPADVTADWANYEGSA